MVGVLMALAGGAREKRATFVVVGVHIDESKANDDNMHIVGTWALTVELPTSSGWSDVQTASQVECAKKAPKGTRCSMMGRVNLDDGSNRERPCAVIALGIYHGMNPDGIRRPYTLWPLKFGFATADAAITWGRAELCRLPSENNNDPLIREVSVSTNCSTPSS